MLFSAGVKDCSCLTAGMPEVQSCLVPANIIVVADIIYKSILAYIMSLVQRTWSTDLGRVACISCMIPCWYFFFLFIFNKPCVLNFTSDWDSWLCGGATGRDHTWSSISGHSCGRYKEDREKKAERAKRDLYRYMHYHNRYKAHTDSFKLESKLKDTIKEKVSNSEEKDSTLRDFSWVTNGLQRLFRSRRVLSYSYPFAFYMFGDDLFIDEMTTEEREIKQHLFEDQQQQLEANVEKLSKFIEEPFDQYEEDKVRDIRMQVINLSVIIDTLCKKMWVCIFNLCSFYQYPWNTFNYNQLQVWMHWEWSVGFSPTWHP